MRKCGLIHVALAVAAVLAMMLGTLSCSSGGGQPTQKTQVLLASGPPEWSVYPIAVGTSDIINRNSNLNITVRSYPGAVAIAKSVTQKQADIAMGGRDGTWHMAYNGYADFQGNATKNLRAVICFNEFDFGVAVRDNNIKTGADLKGKRIAQYTAGTNVPITGFMQSYGINTDKDVIWVPLPGEEEAAAEMQMGRLDAFWDNTTGADMLQLAEAVSTLRFLPWEKDKFDWELKNAPGSVAGAVLRDLKPGQVGVPSYIKQPITLAGYTFAVGTRDDVSADIIYTYTKVFLQNQSTIAKSITGMETFGPTIIQTPEVMPYHEGAIKALKEFKMWTDEMDRVNKTLTQK